MKRITTTEWNNVRHRRLGDYIIAEPVGKGGMGLVFRALNRQTGDCAAVKLLAPHLTQCSEMVQRFEAEARALMLVDHPNVIRIKDFGWLTDGTLYHVLELLDGATLDKVAADHGPFAAEEAAPYVEQICSGLRAVHRRGVVHRDLKPDNIFVLDGRPLKLKLFDFGIAKLLRSEHSSDLTTVGEVLGSPRFMAPEQVAGDPSRIGPHTDIYSLGVTLYWMLSSVCPFQKHGLQATLQDHLTRPPPDIRQHAPTIPDPVAQVIHRCLEKDAVNRPSAAEVARDFAEAVTPTREYSFSLSNTHAIHTTIWPGSPSDRSDTDRVPPVIVPRKTRRRWSVVEWTAFLMGLCGVASAVMFLIVFASQLSCGGAP